MRKIDRWCLSGRGGVRIHASCRGLWARGVTVVNGARRGKLQRETKRAVMGMLSIWLWNGKRSIAVDPEIQILAP